MAKGVRGMGDGRDVLWPQAGTNGPPSAKPRHRTPISTSTPTFTPTPTPTTTNKHPRTQSPTHDARAQAITRRARAGDPAVRGHRHPLRRHAGPPPPPAGPSLVAQGPSPSLGVEPGTPSGAAEAPLRARMPSSRLTQTMVCPGRRSRGASNRRCGAAGGGGWGQVGPTGGGKTTLARCLAEAMTKLRADGHKDQVRRAQDRGKRRVTPVT